MLLLILLILIPILILKRKNLFCKLKKFLKDYKILICIEVLVVLATFLVNLNNNTIIIKEKDPHSNKILKSTVLKEGERYKYSSQSTQFINNNGSNTIDNVTLSKEEKVEEIFIKKVGLLEIKIEKDGEEVKYKYGKGFSYYGAYSCMCGTPIIFYKRTYEIFKIISLSILIIDLILICLMKENKPKGEIENVRND